LVKLRAGSTLSAQSVLAVTHLVSSAVEGLSPDQVSVLDMRGKLLSRPKRPGLVGVEEISDATIEHQQRIEKDVLQKIQLTLAPLLGEDKFRAAVSVECEMNSGEQSEESYDPTKSVMLTSQSSIDSVGSNPPPAPAAAAANSSAPAPAAPRPGAATTRKTENLTFQTSRTVRRLTLPQGAVKTMSISVLLDQGVNWEKTPSGMQKVFVPPSPDTVKVIRDLVAGVSGLKKERGDQLVVESLPFESTVNAEPPPKSGTASGADLPPGILIDGKPLEQFAREPKTLAVAGAATLGLIAILAMLVMRSRKKKMRASAALAAKALASGAGNKSLNRADQGGLANALAAGEDGNALLPEDIARREVMLETIRQEVRANPAMFAGVVQEWLLNTGAK
jgi:flagellar M-ring protein FliF